MVKPIVALSAVFFAVLLAVPCTMFGRGGGGGGFGGGHGGGGFGGGHFGGAGFGGGHFGGVGFAGRGWGGRGYGWGGGGGRGNYGWGGRGYWGYGGWGYPYYGLGLGLGVGLGYGLGYGAYGGYYGGYGYPYGYGYGGYGYGYGYPAYGYGYYGYDPYGISNGAYYAGNPATDPNVVQRQPLAKTAAPAEPAALPPATATQAFLEKGETAFRAGDYKGAVYALRHAAVDDPQNGVMTLLLGQALFASGQFDEAAGATQAAMRQLPKEQWGLVINQYRELYGDAHEYTRQLRVLENAIKVKPNDPALRFLAGFHYAHLGFTKQAIDQLDRVLKAAPRDELARQLREEMQARLEKPPTPVPQAGPALLDEPEP